MKKCIDYLYSRTWLSAIIALAVVAFAVALGAFTALDMSVAMLLAWVLTFAFSAPVDVAYAKIHQKQTTMKYSSWAFATTLLCTFAFVIWLGITEA